MLFADRPLSRVRALSMTSTGKNSGRPSFSELKFVKRCLLPARMLCSEVISRARARLAVVSLISGRRISLRSLLLSRLSCHILVILLGRKKRLLTDCWDTCLPTGTLTPPLPGRPAGLSLVFVYVCLSICSIQVARTIYLSAYTCKDNQNPTMQSQLINLAFPLYMAAQRS